MQLTNTVNQSQATGHFLDPLKVSENQSFPAVLGGIEKDQWHKMG